MVCLRTWLVVLGVRPIPRVSSACWTQIHAWPWQPRGVAELFCLCLSWSRAKLDELAAVETDPCTSFASFPLTSDLGPRSPQKRADLCPQEPSDGAVSVGRSEWGSGEGTMTGQSTAGDNYIPPEPPPLLTPSPNPWCSFFVSRPKVANSLK